MSHNWNDPRLPTPDLATYAELEKADRNLWWRIGCGHHENLFDSARDRIEELEATLQTLREFSQRERIVWPEELNGK